MQYTVTKKCVPLNKEDKVLYFPQAYHPGTVTTKELAKEISAMCTVSQPDVLAVLSALSLVIPPHLCRGEVIDILDLATIKLYLKTKGQKTAQEVTTKDIKGVCIKMLPKEELKKSLNEITFIKKGHSQKAKNSTECKDDL